VPQIFASSNKMGIDSLRTVLVDKLHSIKDDDELSHALVPVDDHRGLTPS
jgi:hypothetical protein